MKRLILCCCLLGAILAATASVSAQPRRYYQHWFQLDAGWQRIADVNAITIYGQNSIGAWDGGPGARAGITFGKDYLSFNFLGALSWASLIFANTMHDIHSKDPTSSAILGLMAFSAIQIPISLGTDKVELTFGYDALKFTRAKAIADKFYLTGSLNAGLNFFLGEHAVLGAYYEFNHTHNVAIGIMNWLGGHIPEQPKAFNCHTFGFRLGWVFFDENARHYYY